MDDSELMSSVIKISGHEARLSLLRGLKEYNKTASDFSEYLGASQSYIHRHLQILAEGGLIKKNGRAFTLTTSGKIFVNSLGGVEVMAKYNDFWDSHSISNVPESIIEGISSLKNTDIIISAPKVIEKILTMISKSNRRILSTTDRLIDMAFSPSIEKIKQGIEIYTVCGPLTTNLKRPDFHSFKLRTTPLENIYMALLVIDDKEACVIFQDKSGSLDWNYCIYGEDPDFISWVEKNFWYMYDKSEDCWSILSKPVE